MRHVLGALGLSGAALRGFAACVLLASAGLAYAGAARSPLHRVNAIGVASRPAPLDRAPGRARLEWDSGRTQGMVGGPTVVYDNTGNPADTSYTGQGGNEAIDDLHLIAGGSLDTLTFEYIDATATEPFSATVRIFGNPSGADLAASPVIGTYTVTGLAGGRRIVAVPLPDAPVVTAHLWVGVRFTSSTAGLVVQSAPTIGSSHDLYLEDPEGAGLYFGGSPRANFALRLVDTPDHPLHVTIAGSGTVTRSPDLAAYVEGSTVELDPTPAAHWHFVGWGGDASGADDPLSVIVDREKTITATFAIDTYTLTYTAGPNGTITGTSPQTVDHGADGSPVTAVPDPGYHFVLWSDGVTTATRTDGAVVADLGVTATFERNDLACNGGFEVDATRWAPYGSVELTRVSPGRESAWSMRIRSRSSSDCGIDDLPNCITGARVGDTYRYTAWFKAGSSSSVGRKVRIRIYEYVGPWPVNASASLELRLSSVWQKLTLDHQVRYSGTSLSERLVYDTNSSGEFFFLDDVGIEILPPPVTFTITATAGPNGSISPPGVATVIQGTSQTYTITPAIGYQIQDVVVDPGTSVGAVASYTFPDVQANRTIHATFVAIPPGQNLVLNPSFESGIQNWTTYGDASLSWNTTDGHLSARSLRITGDDASNGCDDSPNWVPRVAGVGVKYRFKAWVKAANSSSTGKVKIRVYELAGSSQVGSTVYSPESTLTTTRWKLLTAEHTVRQSNTALSMRITNSSDDQTFLVDDVSIERVGSSASLATSDFETDAAPVLEYARPTVYPNPARGAATLALSLARPGVLKAEWYDVAGRLVRVLADDAEAAAGTYRFALEPGATKTGAGIYFYRAEVGGVRYRGRFVLLE